MVAQKNFSERLTEIRAWSAKLRCEAFVDYRPVVCGLTLNPVTLASYNRLIAFDNAFAVGGPPSLEAVCVWVWVHHREFGQFAANPKETVFSQVRRALHPRCENLNAFVHVVSSLPRFRWMARFRVATAQTRFDEVAAHIRHLMAEALYGFPVPTDDEAKRIDAEEREIERQEEEKETGKHLPRGMERFEAAPSVAFQAQILNTFRRDYGMSYAETKALPLKELSQLWREHLWQHAGDKTGLKFMDREEAALWAEQLEDTANG